MDQCSAARLSGCGVAACRAERLLKTAGAGPAAAPPWEPLIGQPRPVSIGAVALVCGASRDAPTCSAALPVSPLYALDPPPPSAPCRHMVEAPFRTPQPSRNLSTDRRSSACVTPQRSPTGRTPPPSLTPVRLPPGVRRPWRTWGTFWPCPPRTSAAWSARTTCALVALDERRRAPRAWRRPGRCSLRCAPLRAALPFGAAVVVQTPASIAQFDRPRTSTGAFIRAWVRLNIPRPIPRTRRTEPDQNDLGRRDCPVCRTFPTP
jgi:hypothetical protein